MCGREMQQRTQGLMMFLGALADGLEEVVGQGAVATCFTAGRMAGMKPHSCNKEVDDRSNVREILLAVRSEMECRGINWPFDIDYHNIIEPESDHSQGWIIPFQNCTARCTLFRYGFPQGRALCQTKHGLFCGLFKRISGQQVSLEILHAGENACLLRLKLFT
ncbi:MAG: hypothetical protein D3916_05200 [Candidatus Electrothrix sp. MAN1_4]|nr:hypothetical protein [Candidatus Electrothrix sp. MAN1_4]